MITHTCKGRPAHRLCTQLPSTLVADAQYLGYVVVLIHSHSFYAGVVMLLLELSKQLYRLRPLMPPAVLGHRCLHPLHRKEALSKAVLER